jgi:hypothetical protein
LGGKPNAILRESDSFWWGDLVLYFEDMMTVAPFGRWLWRGPDGAARSVFLFFLKTE